MYFWAALLSFGAVGLAITGGRAELLVVIGVLLVIGVVVVLSPRARRAAREARAAALLAERERSRADHPTRGPWPPSRRSRLRGPCPPPVRRPPPGTPPTAPRRPASRRTASRRRSSDGTVRSSPAAGRLAR